MTKLRLPDQEPRLCTDLNGRQIQNNERYTPGWDECTVCTCDNGEHKLCQSVMCAPPRQACRQYQVGKKCCEFICLDGGETPHPGYPKDLGLRLVASAVTAVLSLALLLFLVYRLRQRRHRGSPSLRPDEAYNMSLMTYLRGSGYLGGGGRGSHDFYYEEPPPPYSLWKPPQPAAGEAPPPYSEAVRLPELRPGPELGPGGELRPTLGRRPHAVLVLAPAVTAGCVEIARQRATVHRSEPELETGLDSDPDLHSDLHSFPELDPDPDPDLDPDSYPISDRDLELGPSPEPEPEPEPPLRRSRRQPREHPEQVMQRFSLQLQLDCSDSGSSSSPTLTPDVVPRPESVTSSSSADHSG